MIAKPKILIFIDWYLPAFKAGGPVRSIANFITRFEHHYQFYIVCSDRDLGSKLPFDNIKTDKWIEGDNNEHVFYVSSSNQNYNFIQQLISNTFFDKAYINGVFSVKFSVIPMLILRNYKQKVIVAPRGMLHSSALSIKSLKKKLFLGVLKKLGLFKFFIFQAMDEIEKNEIEKNLGKKYLVRLAPNLPVMPAKTIQFKTKKVNELKLFCLSRISPEKNIDFALEVLRRCNFDVQFDIYGSAINNGYLTSIKEKIKTLPPNITVHLKGVVSHSQIPQICPQYDAFFLPTKGENFGHAIYESFANGCPVVVSNQTPWQKLENKGVGFDIDLKETNTFVKVLNTMFAMDDVEYQRMRENSHKLAISIFNNKTTEKAYLQLFA